MRRAPLALHSIGVDIVARKTVKRCDQVGADALRGKVRFDCNLRIHRPGAAGSAHADAAHRFHAAADGDVRLARHDLRGRHVDRLETAGAEPVDLHAGHAVRIIGVENRDARDVGAGFANRIDTSKYHIVHTRRIETVAVANRPQCLGREFKRGDFVESAVRLSTPARRAHGVINEAVRHDVSAPGPIGGL